MVAAYSNKDKKHKDEIVDLVQNYKIGGLMFLQGSPTKQVQLINYYQSIAIIQLRTGCSELRFYN